MMTKKEILTMLFIFVVIQLSGQDAKMSLSLKQSCLLGIEQNVNVQHAALEQQKARYRLREAESKLYPQLEAYSNFSYYYAIPKLIIPGEIFGQTGLIPVEIGTTFDWSNGFRATQLLYSQSYFTSLKLARQMETLSELDLQQKKEEIIFQVSQLYYLCQATREQISLLEASKKNMDRLLGITELQSRNDLIRKTDHSRVSVAADNLQTQIDNLDQLYSNQLGLLKYLIGLPMETEVVLSDTFALSQENMLVDLFHKTGLPERTELQVLDKQIEITGLTRKSIRQSYLPTLTGFGEFYYQGQRNEFDFFKGGNDKFFRVGFVGINLTIPLFDGFEKRSKIKQYDLELMQLRNARENQLEYFSKELVDALNQYKNSLEILRRQEKNIQVAEEIYDVSLQGYRQQVVSLSDLMMSENELTEAHLSYSNALMQLKNAEVEMKKVKGEMLFIIEN
ncbi:TolC family protein [uncultured Proteiniphilum sp.]|uniref:TolC family protein n=1 Tax=uncultured Proteiniphilum sp. TaxID=497637 RepID=UPI00261AACB5|nr:TolC family protein [uncultured Proteiniphilum sp.]